MDSNLLDQITENLMTLTQHREVFQGRFGVPAAAFLGGLPALFRLFHRLAFDLEIPAEQRREAALIAIYISEPHDFCGESTQGVEGLIDDLWLAYSGLDRMARALPAAALERHWRSEIVLADLLALARELRVVEEQVPPRVLDRLKAFLAE